MGHRGIQRVKTGCRTCKARRVKCDEQWPSCRRCTLAGRECVGYGVWGGGRHPGRPPAQGLDLPIHRPSNTGPVGRLSAEDGRVFEWFTLAGLQGVFPFPFWESLLPQACYSEPAILSCVLALGSVHKRACLGNGTLGSQSEVESLESATLRHYNMAINLLKESKSDGSRASTRVTLAACLAFVTIEYLQKRPAQGLLHLHHGLQILNSHSMRQPSCDPVDDWLAEAFDRLDVQAKPLVHIKSDDQPCLSTEASEGRLFALRSLQEARQQLDVLISKAYRLQRQGRIAESSTDISLLFQAISIQQRLQRDLSSWLQAYRAWRTPTPSSSLQPPLSFPEQVARHLLLIYHTMANIITATALYSGNESIFDHHILQFASIIAWSKDALQVYKPVPSSTLSPCGRCAQHFTFTSDLGLVRVLYYTALKCRDPGIRRDALSMLTTQIHQEGIWEGPTAALIAAEVIRLEENPHLDQSGIHHEVAIDRGCNSTQPDSSFPQLWRISHVQVDLPHSPETDLVLVCRRKLGDGTWEVVKRRHNGMNWY
ncbi:C6 zinc finger domain-containing protein [Thelonectria olida]|uniref:C6 zinc finger domain-containing protein n=1 Tax=Thelonectria olida TaxID=1576542 RepID=A0A9P8VV38_9HYPO|nr:C6 zinc finger domain-containing protein [Thelonectria olida]